MVERGTPTALDHKKELEAELERLEPHCGGSSLGQCLIFELTGDFKLVSEPIVLASMRYIRNWYQI